MIGIIGKLKKKLKLLSSSHLEFRIYEKLPVRYVFSDDYIRIMSFFLLGVLEKMKQDATSKHNEVIYKITKSQKLLKKTIKLKPLSIIQLIHPQNKGLKPQPQKTR